LVYVFGRLKKTSDLIFFGHLKKKSFFSVCERKKPRTSVIKKKLVQEDGASLYKRRSCQFILTRKNWSCPLKPYYIRVGRTCQYKDCISQVRIFFYQVK